MVRAMSGAWDGRLLRRGEQDYEEAMWTHAPVADLLPGLRRIAETMSPAPSHMLWMNWGPGSTPAPPRPDMAYSCEDDTS